MSLGRLLLEQGLEVELKADMKDVIAFLDEEVPGFSHDGYGFRMRPLRGVIGSEWKIMINLWDLTNNEELGPPVGLLEVDELDGPGISFKMPPREQWQDGQTTGFDEEGDFFASFVFQLLNAFQGRGLINLPGQLPVV